MNRLAWDGLKGYVETPGLRMNLLLKPDVPGLDFEFESLTFTDGVGVYRDNTGGVQVINLQGSQIIQSYLGGLSQQVSDETLVWGVNELGQALGLVAPEAAFAIAGVPPPNPEGWLLVDGGWVKTNLISSRRDARWAWVKERRESMEWGPFSWGGIYLDGNRESKARLVTAVSISKSNPGFTQQWTLADNSDMLLTAADFIAIEMAAATHVGTVFGIARALRVAIYASSNPETITWPA